MNKPSVDYIKNSHVSENQKKSISEMKRIMMIFQNFQAVKYKHDIVNNNKILFIDNKMNIIIVQNSKNIYNKVYINNVRNLLGAMTTKVKCDEFNNILFGTHKAFFQ